jgi:hypothetical protein
MIFESLALIGVVGVALLATATIWSRKNTWIRGAAVAAFFALTPIIGGASIFALSHPAPYIPGILTPGGEHSVLEVKLVQDEAIYILLDFGISHPRYFALPWNNLLANELQDLMDQQRRGDIPGFDMVIPYEFSWDGHPPQFHPKPQPIVPIPKRRNDNPLRYERGA